MGNREIKKPKLNAGKQIRLSDESLLRDPSIDYPVFCFRYLDEKFGFNNCSTEDKVALIERLAKLSKLSWNQIKLSNRHSFGTEQIPMKQIQSNRPSFVSDDVNSFLAFRFNKLAPFLGHRNGSVFHIIWIDSKFSLYDHGSK